MSLEHQLAHDRNQAAGTTPEIRYTMIGGALKGMATGQPDIAECHIAWLPVPDQPCNIPQLCWIESVHAICLREWLTSSPHSACQGQHGIGEVVQLSVADVIPQDRQQPAPWEGGRVATQTRYTYRDKPPLRIGRGGGVTCQSPAGEGHGAAPPCTHNHLINNNT